MHSGTGNGRVNWRTDPDQGRRAAYVRHGV